MRFGLVRLGPVRRLCVGTAGAGRGVSDRRNLDWDKDRERDRNGGGMICIRSGELRRKRRIGEVGVLNDWHLRGSGNSREKTRGWMEEMRGGEKGGNHVACTTWWYNKVG